MRASWEYRPYGTFISVSRLSGLPLNRSESQLVPNFSMSASAMLHSLAYYAYLGGHLLKRSSQDTDNYGNQNPASHLVNSCVAKAVTHLLSAASLWQRRDPRSARIIQRRKGTMRPRWLMLTMTRDGFLAESYAAWPLHSPKPATRGLLVFDFGAAFSIPDKWSSGTEVLEGAYLPLRNPENPRN